MIILYLFWTKVGKSNQSLRSRGPWTVVNLDDSIEMPFLLQKQVLDLTISCNPNRPSKLFTFSIYLNKCVGICPFNYGSGRCYIHAFIFQKSSRRTKLHSFTCILFILAPFNFKTCRWDSFLSNASTSSAFINKTKVSFHRCWWQSITESFSLKHHFWLLRPQIHKLKLHYFLVVHLLMAWRIILILPTKSGFSSKEFIFMEILRILLFLLLTAMLLQDMQLLGG